MEKQTKTKEIVIENAFVFEESTVMEVISFLGNAPYRLSDSITPLLQKLHNGHRGTIKINIPEEDVKP